MSGGSYGYMFTRVRSLAEQRADLERMALRLESQPWGGRAAEATRRCLTMIDEAESLAETLTDVWHAVEWWDSGDWGEDAARQAVAEYEEQAGG